LGEPARDERSARLTRLSSREAEVLAIVSTGLSNAAIAARLGVTIHAVKFHLAAIYRKLGVSNRTEASALYLAARHALESRGAARVVESA
jgi:DNA-binding CsgD family transcriptional regulator